jgi:hypothetical protein
MFIFQLVEACHQYNKHKTDIIKICNAGLLACSIKMSGSKPKLKVRTLDEMFKKISESSENDPEQLAQIKQKIYICIFLSPLVRLLFC